MAQIGAKAAGEEELAEAIDKADKVADAFKEGGLDAVIEEASEINEE